MNTVTSKAATEHSTEKSNINDVTYENHQFEQENIVQVGKENRVMERIESQKETGGSSQNKKRGHEDRNVNLS